MQVIPVVDEQQVTGLKQGAATESGVWLWGPVAVGIPPPAVLVNQPGCRVTVRAGLGGGWESLREHLARDIEDALSTRAARLRDLENPDRFGLNWSQSDD